MKGELDFVDFQFSPEGDKLIIRIDPLSIFGYDDPAQPGVIYVCLLTDDAAALKPVLLAGHEKWVGATAFLKGGAELLSLGNDNTLRWWDLDSGK